MHHHLLLVPSWRSTAVIWLECFELAAQGDFHFGAITGLSVLTPKGLTLWSDAFLGGRGK